LGHAVDLRDYAPTVHILRSLNVRSVRLMTNNPEKIDAVLSQGIEIAERVSADVPASLHSDRYVATKRERLGHLSNAVRMLPKTAHLYFVKLGCGAREGSSGQAESARLPV
jgi:hypothetical protein